MTPREKEIALEAAARSSNPIEHARKVLEAEAFLRGERPPFVVWPKQLLPHSDKLIDALSNAEKAAWLREEAARHEARAAADREWQTKCDAITTLEKRLFAERDAALSHPSPTGCEPTPEPEPTVPASGAGCAARGEGQTESPLDSSSVERS